MSTQFKRIMIASILIVMTTGLGGCGDEEKSDTYCGSCNVGNYCTTNCNDNVILQGTCTRGEVCKQATDSNYYCFELTENGSIDGICGN